MRDGLSNQRLRLGHVPHILGRTPTQVNEHSGGALQAALLCRVMLSAAKHLSVIPSPQRLMWGPASAAPPILGGTRNQVKAACGRKLGEHYTTILGANITATSVGLGNRHLLGQAHAAQQILETRVPAQAVEFAIIPHEGQ